MILAARVLFGLLCIRRLGRLFRLRRAMRRIHIVAGVLLASLLLAATASAADHQWIEIAGHRVDMTRVPKSLTSETRSNLLRQIAIVDNISLPETVRTFFRQVPIVVDPTLTEMNGQYAEIDGIRAIRARPGRWPEDRAILLHELLHAYHREVLGRPVPPIGRAFEEARREGTYPQDYRSAYFLSNAPEYFAVIAEIYLSGPSFRPPWTCGAVKEAQPALIRYLDGLFGERPCL